MSEQATLRDVISYQPDQYLSDDEIKLIKDTFKNNKRLLDALRKVFLPTITDPHLPLEEFGKDVWLVGMEWNQMSNEQVKSIVMGRQEAIKFIAGGFISLKQIANLPEESPYKDEIKRKNSTK